MMTEARKFCIFSYKRPSSLKFRSDPFSGSLRHPGRYPSRTLPVQYFITCNQHRCGPCTNYVFEPGQRRLSPIHSHSSDEIIRLGEVEGGAIDVGCALA